MCVKFSSEDLNPDPCPPHPTSTYNYGVMCDGSGRLLIVGKKLISIMNSN